MPEPPPTELPAGFSAHVARLAIRDDTDDFLVILSDRPAVADAVFTRSRFAGPSVTLSRRHLADRRLQAYVVVSKNANVATGPEGERNAGEVVDRVAEALGIAADDVLIASTGVIGWPYPMDRLRAGIAALRPPLDGQDAVAAARAMMTTDTVPKVATARAGNATVVGMAKGVGMIEPDMATLIVLVCTDAEVGPEVLSGTFRSVMARTFNALSIDTDTSTSDTAAVMANGRSGPIDRGRFEVALNDVALSLTRQIARDGEGATKVMEVTVTHAASEAQAKRVAKAVVNSPLVKTAVHGADPNWGRVVMAVGKCSDDTDIDPDRTVIRFGGQEVFPTPVGEADRDQLSAYMAGDTVAIGVALGIGDAAFTVYGCDLSADYVRINAEYTT